MSRGRTSVPETGDSIATVEGNSTKNGGQCSHRTATAPKITGLTLFSGGGGVELGLRHLVHFVGGVEYDPEIAAHAQAALGTPITVGDVRDVDYRQWSGVDYLHLSPPCTRASNANSKAGEAELDKRLGEACCRAIAQTGARVVTLENVPGYKDFEAFRTICTSLRCQGYRVHWAVYDAADCGVPQHRDRLLLRAWREDKLLPDVELTHASPKEAMQDALQPKLFGGTPGEGWYLRPRAPWIGWYEATADLLPTCPESQPAPWQEKRLIAQYGENWLEKLIGECGAYMIGAQGYDKQVQHVPADEPGFTPNTTSVAGAYRALLLRYNGENGTMDISAGEPAAALTADGCGKSRALLINGIPGSFGGGADVRQGDEPAPPLTASFEKHPMRVCDGVRWVSLTPRCVARLQSVPDDYALPDKKSLATKIIGNMVPPLMARVVFGSVLEEVA